MKKFTSERAKLIKTYRFSESELNTLRSAGWGEDRVLAEVEAYVDSGLCILGEAHNEFLEQYGNLIDSVEENLGENIDVFESFGFYTIPDLTEEERRPPEFIIDNMLPVGMTFLSGAPKTKKSFLALQMAIAVANGNNFFGHETQKCDVAYLDLEGSKSRSSARTEHSTSKIPRNLYVTNMTKEKLSGKLMDNLRLLHQQRPEIRLIIIDTYGRARGQVKSNGANAFDTDVTFLEPIQRMAIEENIAIFFVHHESKGGNLKADPFERISGSMGISASADCVLQLLIDGKRSDGKATLEITPRDAKGEELKLEFNERLLEWVEWKEEKIDLRGNPVCNWIIEHCPEPSKEGVFFSYQTVYTSAYHTSNNEIAGTEIRRQIDSYGDQLFSEYRIGVQLGVKSHDVRGIRIINLN